MPLKAVSYGSGDSSSFSSGSMKQRAPATPGYTTVGRRGENSDRVFANGTVSVIKTAEQICIEPAYFVSFLALAAPIRQKPENSASRTPDMVIPFVAADRITNRAVTGHRNPG